MPYPLRSRNLMAPAARNMSSPPAQGRRAERGFTLPELVLSMALIAFVASFAISSFFSLSVMTLHNALRLLADDIHEMQARATSLQIPVELVFDPAGDGYHAEDRGAADPRRGRLFPLASRWIDLAVDQLTRRRDALLNEGEPAIGLARTIGRTVPLIQGGGAIGATAASRWKTQINENANAPAFWSTSPELCHNEIQGWGQHGDVTRQLFTVVQLSHEFEHPQVSRRTGIVRELLQEVVADVVDVQAEGEGQLAQALDLILVGDVTSLHLAAQEGLDPGPVPALERMKAELRS